jgi:hypothetical protein
MYNNICRYLVIYNKFVVSGFYKKLIAVAIALISSLRLKVVLTNFWPAS